MSDPPADDPPPDDRRPDDATSTDDSGDSRTDTEERTATETRTDTGADAGTDDRSDADPARNSPTDVDSGTGVGDRPSEPDPRDPSTQIANEERRRKTSVISGLVAALGLWVAVSVLVFDASETALWNNLLVGAAVLLAAGYNGYRLSSDVPLSIGVATLVAVLGIWLIVSAALFEMLGMLFWSTIAAGLLIAGLAGYNAYEAREAQTVATETA